jgi:hypothetical protein
MRSSFSFSPEVFALGALLALVWSYSCLTLAGYLRTRIGLRTGYTRKIFHALIFLSAAIAHAVGGFVAVCVFGAMVSLVLGLAASSAPCCSGAHVGSPFESIAQARVIIDFFSVISFWRACRYSLAQCCV